MNNYYTRFSISNCWITTFWESSSVTQPINQWCLGESTCQPTVPHPPDLPNHWSWGFENGSGMDGMIRVAGFFYNFSWDKPETNSSPMFFFWTSQKESHLPHCYFSGGKLLVVFGSVTFLPLSTLDAPPNVSLSPSQELLPSAEEPFPCKETTCQQWKKGPWLFLRDIGDEILLVPSYVGIIINHYKDPY